MALNTLRTLFLKMGKLSDKIWTTRKTRIYAEKRLLFNEKISNIVMIWYSLCLVFVSIWSLIHSSQFINIMLLSSSIAILVVSVFLYSQKYSERAVQMRQCYIRLDELAAKSEIAELNNEIASAQNIHETYSDVLSNIENHIDYDYHRFRYSKRNDPQLSPPFRWEERANYYWEHGLRWVGVLLLFLFPLIAGYLLHNYVSIQ